MEGRSPPAPLNGASWVLDVEGEGEPTFLGHLLALTALHGTGPWPDRGYPLPDDPPPERRSFFPSVAMDGSRSHHFGIDPDPATVTDITERIAALVTGPPDGPRALDLHRCLAGCSALDLADDLSTALRERGLPRERVRAVGRWLVEHGTRRAAVKFGLVLLGVSGDTTDRDLLLLFGSLDEFTLYAVIALIRTQPDRVAREEATFTLARRVRGWGRIHAVERLAGTDDPKIRSWLLREGFRNDVMDEYLAHLAATTGHLYEALLDDDIDDALLDGAGGILAAMADSDGGPAKGLTAYPEALPALHRYATLLEAAPGTLRRLRSLLAIRVHLQHPPQDTPWDPDAIQTLLHRYETLAARADWPDAVHAHMADPSADDFALALWPADQLGLRPLPAVLAHLDAVPDDGYAWHWAIRHADHTEAEAIIDLAGRHLTFAPLTDPGLPLHPGPLFALATTLESLVSGLTAHPGLGHQLLQIAAASPAQRLRRAALRTLRTWPPEHLTPALAHAVDQLERTIEPGADHVA